MIRPLPDSDLTHILERTRDLWEDLRGERIFITGGTGFYGRWLVESLAAANQALSLDLRAVLLTRNLESSERQFAHLPRKSCVTFLQGDIRDFKFPEGLFSHFIHAATDASATLNLESPKIMFDTITSGTQRALELAAQAGTRNFLFASSGAVYGPQPAEITHLEESYPGCPDPLDPASAYGRGKKMAEELSLEQGQVHGFSVKIARGYAFHGPHLRLDGTFAIGNFLRDALRGGPIQILGDGSPYRSYLYAADLAIWLWTLLLRGPSGRAYNVGSDQSLSILELATSIGKMFGVKVEVQSTPKRDQPVRRYVPSIQRARSELGLEPWISLEQGFARTAKWLRSEKV